MVKYDGNQPYNDLPLLPPSIDLLEKEVLVALVQAARSLAELNRNTLRLPNPAGNVDQYHFLTAGQKLQCN